MREKALDRILEGFDPNGPESETVRSGAPVTVWLPAKEKARYDRLQQMSKGRGRRFSDVAREALIAVIDAAEHKAS